MIWIYLIAFILTVGGYVGWYCEYRCVKKKDVIIKRHIDIGTYGHSDIEHRNIGT